MNNASTGDSFFEFILPFRTLLPGRGASAPRRSVPVRPCSRAREPYDGFRLVIIGGRVFQFGSTQTRDALSTARVLARRYRCPGTRDSNLHAIPPVHDGLPDTLTAAASVSERSARVPSARRSSRRCRSMNSAASIPQRAASAGTAFIMRWRIASTRAMSSFAENGLFDDVIIRTHFQPANAVSASSLPRAVSKMSRSGGVAARSSSSTSNPSLLGEHMSSKQDRRRLRRLRLADDAIGGFGHFVTAESEGIGNAPPDRRVHLPRPQCGPSRRLFSLELARLHIWRRQHPCFLVLS